MRGYLPMILAFLVGVMLANRIGFLAPLAGAKA